MNKRMLLVCLLASCTVLLHQRTVEPPAEPSFPGPETAVTVAQEAPQESAAPLAVAPAGPMAVVTGTVRGAVLPVAAGHIVARIPAEAAGVDARLRTIGSAVLHTSKWTGRARLAVPDGMTPNAFADFVSASGIAEGATPDPICVATDDDDDDNAVSDGAPLYPLQWHHSSSNTDDQWARDEYNSHAGGAVVAVLDTGIAFTTRGGNRRVSDLDAVRFHAPYNAFSGNTAAHDDHQHGTHIASVISGHGGALGTGYGRDLMPVKVLDSNKQGTESTLVDGMHHAMDNGAAVVNMSLSFPKAYLPGPDLAAAVARAQNDGVALVASAGNNGEPWVSYPAAFPSVIAVGAARMQKWFGNIYYVRAEYSNYGPGLDLMAPGGDINRDENNDGFPDGILAQSFPLNNPDGPDTYFFVSGTSAAAAQVSAVAANLLDEGADASDLRWVLHEYTTKMVENWWTSDFAPPVGGGLLDTRFATRNSHRSAPYGTFGAGAAVVLTDAGNGAKRALAVVEAVDSNGNPVASATVWASWVGDVEGYSSCVTNSDGQCSMESPAAQDATLIGVSVQGLVPAGEAELWRTVPITRMELRAYRLFGSLGTGLASSSLILDYNQTALDWLGAWTSDALVPTVTVKNTGTGLASSSIVLGLDYLAFSESTLASKYTVFQTGGTGLASSSIVLDPNFYNLNALSDLDNQTATIWGFPIGTGLASSSIVVDQTSFAWDAFISPYATPGVLYFNNGTGLASSSLILDTTFWNPDLFRGTPSLQHSYYGTGTGLASSSFVFDYNLGTLDWLGFDTGGFDLNGTGLASSSLVLDDGYLNSFALSELSSWYAYGLDHQVVGASVGAVEMQ